MHDLSKRLRALNSQRPFRYLVNGCVATGVHFVVLVFSMQVLNWSSAGAANGLAALFGIATSFVGSRYYVFKHSFETAASQVTKFLMLYLCIALLHAGVLLVWTDYYQLNYVIGFFVATLMQLMLSYWGNKVLVFKV
jgi:putative flippase GtrA